MIQKITIKNFLSFKDEVTFSFDASNDKFAEDCQVVKINDNTRLLRLAIIYGYNASGKTNLLKAFNYLSYFWFHTTKNPDQKTEVEPFKLNKFSATEPTSFDLVFWVSTTKYRYQLELDETQVFFEKLSYYETIQPTMLFERKLENNSSVIEFGNIQNNKVSEIVRESIESKCLNNMSFFAARRQVNTTIQLIDTAIEYLRKRFMPIITPEINLTQYAKRSISEDTELTSYLVDFLQEADFNIIQIQTEEVKKDVSNEFRERLSNDEKKFSGSIYIKKIYANLKHSVVNDKGIETYQFSLENGEESQGTIRTLGIETALYKALKQSAFLTIDEIETSLHPKLQEKILFEYLKNQSQSQLIVTTHNDGLLDLISDLIRKDSIWFTEKQKSGVTDLYKLTDFRGVNRLSSIREAYRNKRFGATMN